MEYREDHEEIVAVKKYILDHLASHSIEYKYSLDYIHNHKNEKYREMMMTRTNLSASELYKEATSFVAQVNKYIFDKLCELASSKRVMLMCDDKKLESFIKDVNEYIRGNSHEVFVHRG